jgi:hypothetical protein
MGRGRTARTAAPITHRGAHSRCNDVARSRVAGRASTSFGPRSALARLAGKIAPERRPAPKGMRVGPMTTQIVVSGPHCDGATHPAPIRRVTGFRVLRPPPTI